MASHWTGLSDESFAGSTMVLSVVRVADAQADDARAALRDLLIGRAGQLHFSKESDDRRGTLAKAVGALGLDLIVVVRRSRDSDARARAVCLTTVAWALHDALDLLVIESRGPRQDGVDADVLARLAAGGCRLPVHFLGKRADPLLWAADILASATFQAVGRGVPGYLEALGHVRRIDC